MKPWETDIGRGAVLYDTRPPERRLCCSRDEGRHLHHVTGVYEETTTGQQYYRIQDATHTTEAWVEQGDVEALFEPAGWSYPATQKPLYYLTRQFGVVDCHDVMTRPPECDPVRCSICGAPLGEMKRVAGEEYCDGCQREYGPDEVDDPAGTPHRAECPECEDTTVHDSHYRCIESHQVNERLRSKYTETSDSDRLITDGGTDRARFLYTSIMRQVSDCGPDEKDRVVGFHGKEPESTIKRFIVDDEVTAAKYERLELIKFDCRMSNEDLHSWYREEDPLTKWCDEDGFYEPNDGLTPGVKSAATSDPDRLITDGGIDSADTTECWRCGRQRYSFESCHHCGASCKPRNREKQQQDPDYKREHLHTDGGVERREHYSKSSDIAHPDAGGGR